MIDFLLPRTAAAAEEMDADSARSDLLLRHDDGVIREVFNNRAGEITLLSASAAQAEIAKRESLLVLIYRLYRIGRNHTPADLRRELHAADVEAVISSLQRLSFMGSCSLEELIEFCEVNGNGDDDVLAHVMDPLQLRYILTFHRAGTREEISHANVDTLIACCRNRNSAGVRSWFQALTSSTDTLPGDAPQYFRSVLLDLWKAGGADLGTLAYEIAVLDAQLFNDLGWESTRAFCAQLRRVTGPGCESLDAYLTDEDIDGALVIAEELQQEELILHFRRLAVSYSTKLHRETRRNVLVAAGQAREAEPVIAQPRSNTQAQTGFRSMGWSAAG